METQQTQNQENALQPIENMVENAEGQMFTTSLIIAQAFEKEHKDVLKAISNLECSETFNERNFAPVEYKDAKGEMRPAYRITRDGFAFLAMGFTGKKAAEWKEKFLEAFNAMEKCLMKKEIDTGIDIELPPVEENEIRKERLIKALRGITAYWAFVDKMQYSVAEMALCRHIGIERLTDITEETEEGLNIINNAFNYLWDVTSRPTGDMEGPRATSNEVCLLRYMLDACGQWKFTRDENFEEFFKNKTGINSQSLGMLSSHDATKMLARAGCLLHETYLYTDTLNLFIKESK